MAGQGLGPLMNKKPDIVIAPPTRSTHIMPRRDSPTYDPYRCHKQNLLFDARLAPIAIFGAMTRE